MDKTSLEALNSIIILLNSSKKKEKINALEQLTNLFNQDETCKILCHNTLKLTTNNINWKIVFTSVHNAVFSIIEQNETKNQQISDKLKQLMQNIILIIVQKSIYQKNLLISSRVIVSSVLSIFKSNIRAKILGSTYINILHKYVMSDRRNWCQLSEDQWVDLKNVCKNNVKSSFLGTHNVIFLEILCDVIKHSSKTCLIHKNFLDIFDFVQNIFFDVKNLGINFEFFLLRLINILCLQLAIEFRYKVCEFTENVFDYIISSYRKNNSDLNMLVYHFLIITLNVHNPNGVNENDKSFYASDLCKWKTQIRKIYFVCLNLVQETLKNSNHVEIATEILDLLVDVSHLMPLTEFNCFKRDDSDISFNNPGPNNKRKCLYTVVSESNNKINLGCSKIIKLQNIIEELVSNLQSPNAWFWLKFLFAFINKYPQDLETKYYDITEVLCDLCCDKKDTFVKKASTKCLSSLVEIFASSGSSNLYLTNIWNKISIDFFSNPNANSETHTLLQALIKHIKIQDPEPIVKLYYHKILQPNLDNFRTLSLICQKCTLPEVICSKNSLNYIQNNYENVKERLLVWLVEGEEKYPCKDLAKLLISLILKKFDERNMNYIEEENILMTRTNISDFCKAIVYNYKATSFKGLHFTEKLKNIKNNFSVKIDFNLKEFLDNLLNERWMRYYKSLCSEESNIEIQESAIQNCIWFCELLCHLLSYSEVINMPGLFEKQAFLENLKLMLSTSTKKALDVLKIKFFNLESLYCLYKANFHKKIQKTIRQPNHTDLNLLQFFYKLFVQRKDVLTKNLFSNDNFNLESNSEFSQLIKSTKSIFHFQILTKSEKALILAVELLCQYIVSSTYSDANACQTSFSSKIIDDLLKDEIVKTCSNFQLQLVMRIVYSFSRFNGITVPEVIGCLDLMSIILNKKIKEPDLHITMIQILKNFLPFVHVSGNPDVRLKFIQLISEYRTMIFINRSCGINATTKYIECLAEIFKYDEGGSWALIEECGSEYKIFEDIIGFLKHPYHEIRLFAAQRIGLLFKSLKNTKEPSLAWQKKMLKNLVLTLSENNNLYAIEKGCYLEYTISVLSSISLISLAHVFCLSNFWKKKALFYLIFTAHKKKIKATEVCDILLFICGELKIKSPINFFKSNFLYLLCKWVKKELPINDFPYYHLGYNNHEEFMRNHFQTIVMVYFKTGRLDIIDIISSATKKSVVEILRESHSVLMSFVLPNLLEETPFEESIKAKKIKTFLDENLTSKLSMQYLAESLDKVIFYMIRHMYDSTYLLKLCEFNGNVKGDKTLMSNTSIQIIHTLDNLSSSKSKVLLAKLSLEMPFMIEKVLIFLMEDVEQAVIYEDKIFAFYKYIFFVEILSEVVCKDSQYGAFNAFFIREVIYSLTAIIRNDNCVCVLTNMACSCFKIIAKFLLPEFSLIFSELLPVIITVLTPLAENSATKALDVIQFLVCDNYLLLEPSIVFLDPFPSNDKFSKIHQQITKKQRHERNLSYVINHFIKAGNNNNTGCRIEGLKYLRHNLSEKKTDLKEMYENLSVVRGFSEDCKKSLLHQLICKLVELTTNENVAVKMESAKCLGELGPSDLTTLVLRPENNFPTMLQSDSAVTALLKTSLSALPDLLISNNFPTKKAASKALYAVLSARQSQDILQSHIKTYKNFKYLVPYVSASCENLILKIDKEVFIKKMNNDALWKCTDHKIWIVNLVESLLQSLSDSLDIIKAFRELILIHWQFAEELLCPVLDLILAFNDEDCSIVIINNFHSFFEINFNTKNETPVTVNKKSVQSMLNIVDYIRLKGSQEAYKIFCSNLNFLNFAKAALYCAAFFTSLLYAELWFQQKNEKNGHNADINKICELYPDEGSSLTEILRECHSKIGNIDGIHGCGFMHILDAAAEIHHYEQVKNWHLALLHHDIQLSIGNTNFEEGLVNSLHSSGMYYTLNNLIKANKDSLSQTSVQYKCALQLSDWSLLDSNHQAISEINYGCFDKSYYFALKAFYNEDDTNFYSKIKTGTKSVITRLINCSLESTKNLYQPLAELQSLKELEDFVWTIQNSDLQGLRILFDKWRKQDSITCSDYDLMEVIQNKRTVFIKLALSKLEKSNLKTDLHSMLCETYYKIIVSARKEKKYETAIRTLSCVNTLSNIPNEIFESLKLERARIFWEKGDQDIGRFLLSYFLKKNEIRGELKAKGFRIYGDWMAKTKSENSREIIENYYLKSISQFSTNNYYIIDSFASLAKFADSNYEQLNEYLTSPMFETKQNLISTQQDLATELRQELGWNQNREKRMAYNIAARQSIIDKNEIKNSITERDSYLQLALKYYLLCLKEGEKYNLLIFRVISMWLSNATNEEVIRQLKYVLPSIPTYKFLCLLPQLIPRMVDVCLISDLIERILQDHPYHTLPHLFALSNSYEDLKYSGNFSSFSSPRVQTAKSILNKFQTDHKLENFINEMEKFSNALIQFANYSPQEKGIVGLEIDLPEYLQITKTKNLSTVAVPTLHIPYQKNCIYNNITSVHKFESEYYLVGGINLPKRVKCIGSDGISRSLLIKGKDDLRQDAVMQQVFTIMNSLLSQDHETKKRKLIIRTYKVVPLSQRSGIIEWCENTQPLSLYLTGSDGKSGAHKKYHPDEISASECRNMIRKVFAQPHSTNEDKLKVFLEVCSVFHPVFHNFFLEKFPAAGVWFERKLAYIHSVATSSMIGYILGIGDRHVNNILIDNSSAEVIHIDLGIAFEQGRTLPIPETVPFRLTRDIVNGMGVSGVEGDFRVSCIKTMKVLRDNQDIILTLLEVLLYDPLYAWTITPGKAFSMQGHAETCSTSTEKSSPDVEINKMAERALIRLKQKLQGTEVGWVATNIEGQVSYLIHQARDPNNLSRLFHGWQAYL